MNIYEVLAAVVVDHHNYRGRARQVVEAVEAALMDKDLEPGRYTIEVRPVELRGPCACRAPMKLNEDHTRWVCEGCGHSWKVTPPVGG